MHIPSRWRQLCFGPVVLLLGTAALFGADAGAGSGQEEIALRSGASMLACPTNAPVRLMLGNRAVTAEVPWPLRVEMVDAGGRRRTLTGTYATAVMGAEGLRATGELWTPAGSVFRFEDTYAPAPDGAFILRRTVTVINSNAGDAGFLTRYGLCWATPTSLVDCEGFLPGVWYQDNHNVPPSALAADLRDARIWVREDRLPLPLIMLRRKDDGTALLLAHLQPDGSTAPTDTGLESVTDARLRFASLGVTTPERPELTVVYPGAEADRTYLGRGRRDPAAGGAWRYHPVQVGLRQEYMLLLAGTRQEGGFASAMRWAWRAAYAQARPVPVKLNLRAVYEASLHLLGTVADNYNGAPGLPFCIHLPGGAFARTGQDVSFQMGFVGQQLPAAYHLLREGTLAHNVDAIRKAEAILDFWSAQSPTPEGLPRTWYDPYPQGHWRNYPTFLRVASDGMVGALQAWDFVHRNGRDRPAWLRFCRRYGDWLVACQYPDGSWFREYDSGGHPGNQGKQNTTHPIRYLVDLAAATGDRRYAEAAVRAGEFSLANIDGTFSYVGGTADNPNVIDKEAGFMATDAFLALHDLTGDARYLAAAARAADFMETWVYGWNVPPMPGATTRGSLPVRLPVSGFSLIATGHSAADLFMAGAPFLYERLYVATGDLHYRDIARLLLYNPRQFVDVNGSLGYGQPGLVSEALTLAVPRDGGVNAWLPWLTVSMVEPMVRLEETFGSMTLDVAPPMPNELEVLRAQAARLQQSRAAVWAGKPVQ